MNKHSKTLLTTVTLILCTTCLLGCTSSQSTSTRRYWTESSNDNGGVLMFCQVGDDLYYKIAVPPSITADYLNAYPTVWTLVDDKNLPAVK